MGCRTGWIYYPTLPHRQSALRSTRRLGAELGAEGGDFGLEAVDDFLVAGDVSVDIAGVPSDGFLDAFGAFGIF